MCVLFTQFVVLLQTLLMVNGKKFLFFLAEWTLIKLKNECDQWNNVLIRICGNWGIESCAYRIHSPAAFKFVCWGFSIFRIFLFISLKRGVSSQTDRNVCRYGQAYQKPIFYATLLFHIYSFSGDIQNTQCNQLYLVGIFFLIRDTDSFCLFLILSLILCGQMHDFEGEFYLKIFVQYNEVLNWMNFVQKKFCQTQWKSFKWASVFISKIRIEIIMFNFFFLLANPKTLRRIKFGLRKRTIRGINSV